jgi:heme/copper-type cytochrome/quinol oxidase subunit 2
VIAVLVAVVVVMAVLMLVVFVGVFALMLVIVIMLDAEQRNAREVHEQPDDRDLERPRQTRSAGDERAASRTRAT